MPIVAIINGIAIAFYYDEHPPPHFHARFAEFQAQIDIDTLNVIKGMLPNPQLQIVKKWAATRKEQLRSAWTKCQSDHPPGKIR